MTRGAVEERGSGASRPHHDGAVRVRRATRDDLRVVIELRLALLRCHPRHAVYGRLRRDAADRARTLFAAQLVAEGEAIFLAEREGRVIGILRCVEMASSPLLDPTRYCYLSSVYVRPAERRRGVMRALLASARAWCTDRGLDEMRLHNVPGGEAGASWTAAGFEVVEEVRTMRLR